MLLQDDSSAAHRLQRDLAEFQDRDWRTGAFRFAAIGILAASIVVAPLAIVRALVAWPLAYVVPLAFLIALEGIFSTGHLGRPEWRDRRGLAFRLGEIVLIVLVSRLAVWAFSAGWPGPDSLRVLLRHPGAFLDAQTVIVTGLLLLVWFLAISVAADFSDLAIQPDEVAARQIHDWGDSRSHLRVFRPVARGDIVARFTARWLWGALPLVVLTGLSQLNINQDARGLVHVGLAGMGLERDVLVGLLCYFLAGLLLLSDARLAVLRGRWYNERVAVAPPLLRRWHWLGLCVLLTLAGVALLLPLGPVGPLARALEWLVTLVMSAGIFLAMLLSFLLSVLLYPFRWLFRQNGEAPSEVAAPALPTPLEAASRVSLPDWLGGALVWVVVGLVAGYLLLNFLRGQGLLRMSWAGRLVSLRLWWRARRARIDATIQARRAALRARWRRGRSVAAAESSSSRRPGALPPRAKVRYFYLQAVRRAAEQGHARPPHVTPTEYARDLQVNWPDAEEDVQGLTAAFLDARYAPYEIAPDRVRNVQVIWRRLMRVLRQPAPGDQV